MPIHWLPVNYLAVSKKQMARPKTVIGGKWRDANFATSCRGFHLSIICRLGGCWLTMQRSQNLNGDFPGEAGKHVEEVLRFARKLGMHSDPEQLLRALPSELCALLDCTTAAVIHLWEGEPTFHV